MPINTDDCKRIMINMVSNLRYQRNQNLPQNNDTSPIRNLNQSAQFSPSSTINRSYSMIL
jgi:hypothetical protein